MLLLANTGIEFVNLGLKFKFLPKGFYIDNFFIAFYGVIIGLGMIAGTLIACNYAKRSGQNPEDYLDLAIWLIASCVIGARLYYVIFSWDYYKDNPMKVFDIRGGGLAIYGGILTGIVVCIIYRKIKHIPFALIGDTAILGVVIGQAIGRWGNFVNREAFGGTVGDKSLFAMRLYFDKFFDAGDVPSKVLDDMSKMLGKNVSDLEYVQVHPTFLYESLFNRVLFGVLMFMSTRKKFNGQLVLTYFMGYGVCRFFVEGLRTDQLQIGSTGIAVSQVVSAVLAVGAGVLMIYNVLLYKKGKTSLAITTVEPSGEDEQ